MQFMNLDHVWVGGVIFDLILKIVKTMKIIRIIIALTCCFGIIKSLLNIIWLYKPNALNLNFLQKMKYSSRFEKVTLYLASIVCMSYYIYYIYTKYMVR